MNAYTLDTDFSALDGPNASRWLDDFQDLAEDAFRESDNRHRLLGNLLVLERYIHTLQQGGTHFSKGTLAAVDLLWSYLLGRAIPKDFARFANNLYACLLAYAVGEDLTDEQAAFDKEYFDAAPSLSAYEDTAAGWAFGLLLQLVALEGGELDYDEFQSCKQVDFSGIEEMLNLFDDACIELTRTPCPSNFAKDVLKAIGEVHLTPLYRQIVAHIQHDLHTALSASPEQYAALRETYRACTILPEEYAAPLVQD